MVWLFMWSELNPSKSMENYGGILRMGRRRLLILSKYRIIQYFGVKLLKR